MASKLIFIFIFAFICRLNGVVASLPASAVHNASTGLLFIADNPADAFVNPALIVDGAELGVTRIFNISDLPLYSAHYGYRSKFIGLYLGTVHLDHHLYSESVINLSTAYLVQHFSIGGSFRTVTNKAKGYRRNTSLLTDFGFVWLGERLSSGFSVKNITNTKSKEQAYPILFQIETGYKIGEDGSLSIGVEKERGYEFTLKTASSYRVHDGLKLIAGYQHRPARIGTGFVLSVNTFSVNYGMLSHENLAATHFFSIGYRCRGGVISEFRR